MVLAKQLSQKLTDALVKDSLISKSTCILGSFVSTILLVIFIVYENDTCTTTLSFCSLILAISMVIGYHIYKKRKD